MKSQQFGLCASPLWVCLDGLSTSSSQSLCGLKLSEDVNRAVQAAQAAFPGWRDTSVKQRAEARLVLGNLQ
eukprot:2580436-Amphidinium_carterae.1